MKKNNNENENCETVADILAEYRDDLCLMISNERPQMSFMYISTLLDRIKEAWKRERATVEADALSAGGLVEAMRRRRKPVGNAAAKSEALIGLAQAVREFMANKGANFYPDVAIALEAANVALSAPARNCDLFDNWYDAHQAWERLPKDELGYFVAANGVHECEQAWLFAPAAEQKGERDGK